MDVINNKIEQYGRNIASVILVLGIISGVILVLIGCNYIGGYRDESSLATIYIIAGIIDVLSATVFWVLLNLLVNISIKLSSPTVNLSKDSVNSLTELLKPKQETPIKIDQKTISSHKSMTDLKKIPELADTKSKSDDELENIVLGEVLSGNIIYARQILMTKKGMSLTQADEYIEKLKK